MSKEDVTDTLRRAALRGEWLRLRVEVLRIHLRDSSGEAEPIFGQLGALEEELATQESGHFSTLRKLFDLDAAEALLLECLAASELPGAACAALLELGGHIATGGTRVLVDALLAAITGGMPDAAAALLLRLGPAGRLRRHGLVEVDDGDRPRRLAPVRLGQGVLEILLGAPIDVVQSQAEVVTEDAPPVDPFPALCDQVAAALSDPARPCVVLVGAPGAGQTGIVIAAARSLGRPVLRMDAELLLSATEGQRDVMLRRLGRDAVWYGAVVLVDGLGADEAVAPGAQAPRRAALRALSLVPAPLAVAADGEDVALGAVERPLVRIAVGLPAEEVRSALWSAYLPPEPAQLLARTFALGPRAIQHAGITARVYARATSGMADGEVVPGYQEVRQAIRSLVAGGLAARELGGSDYRPRLDALVLSAENRELLDELVVRVRKRRQVFEQWGFRAVAGPAIGVAALFHGPPGTGKSMAAHAMATELGVECLRVDLSQVVSKWVGETEKSLARMFDVAERSDALLLFDEADALFTRRTDVKSSNDRYANLEVNYLLQRIEAFPGLAVLTTNHIAAIDPAFQRRLSVQIHFDFPDAAERARLWRCKLPPEAPLGPDVLLEVLGERYAMTGARIRNAALRAAFYAAEAGSIITQAHLERAIQTEFRSAGLAPGATRHLE